MAEEVSGRAPGPVGSRESGGRGREGIVCFQCGFPGHVRRSCSNARGPKTIACAGRQVNSLRAPTLRVKVNGEEGEALVDSGCTQTIVRAPEGAQDLGGRLWILCVHRDIRPYHKMWAKIEVEGRTETLQVERTPHLKYIAILGRDYTGFFSLLSRAQQREALQGERGEDDSPDFWGSAEVSHAQEDPSLREAWH